MSPGTNDALCERITLLALLPSSPAVPVLGLGTLPAPVVGAAVAVTTVVRAGSQAAFVPAPPSGPAPAGQLWPPPSAGAKTICDGAGNLPWAGFSWNCKNSGPQGPGDNVFSRSLVWADAYGLHL